MPAETPAPKKKSKKKKKAKKTNVVAVILFTLLFLVIACVLLVFLFIESKISKIDFDVGTPLTQEEIAIQQNFDPVVEFADEPQIDVSELPVVRELSLPMGAIKQDDDVLNVLLLGTDERDFEFNYASRADACMLVSLNFKEGTGKLVSFERGMGVLILDGQYAGQYDWLTHCFRYGGADLMLREIRELFHVDVDHYVRINLNMLIKIVDAVGGVDVELTQAEADYINRHYETGYRGDSNDEYQIVHEGWNHLNGVSALDYARCRHIDSDWQRIGRQRNLVQAFVNEIKNADFYTLNNLLDTLLPMVRTNFTRSELLALIPKAPSMLGVKFDQLTIPEEGHYGGMPVMNGNGGFAPDLDYHARLLEEFLYGNDD